MSQTKQQSHQSAITNLISGTISGSTLAGLLNPWDRALYLSVVNSRKFLCVENFKSPYQGFSQAVFQRVISGGLYFFLQGEIGARLDCFELTPVMHSLTLGTLAGLINGIILNQFAAIKYHSWGTDGMNFRDAVAIMWRKGGIRPFFKGISMTGARDTVFGVTYELTRMFNRNLFAYLLGRKAGESSLRTIQKHEHGHAISFSANFTAALFATIYSAPLNYVRNIEYSMHPGKRSPGWIKILSNLLVEARQQRKEGGIYVTRFIAQRFRIGWGSARVGFGMALGQFVFEEVRDRIEAIST